MNSNHTETNFVAQRHIKAVRLVLIILAGLTLLLASLASELRIQLFLTGISLIIVGWFIGGLLKNYKNIAVLLLNTLILFVVIEFVSTSILATAKIPFVRGVLGNIMGRPNQIVDHYLALPYYSDQEWSARYWNELEQALKKDYYPYVIWRSPSFSGELLNIDQHGVRKTPGAECLPDSFRIYMFGGSSAWGWGAPDWGTIPAYLQEKLADFHDEPICVVNYGENAFVSTQNVIQLIMLLENDDVPDVVIFYDGVNEVLAASQNGEPIVHQNFDQVAELFVEPDPPFISWIKSLNTFVLFQTVVNQSGLIRPSQPDDSNIDFDQLATSVVRAYMNNYLIVESLAETYGFEYYFFLQPYILVGEKPLSDEEREMITGLNWVFDLNPDLAKVFTTTYEQIDLIAPGYMHLYSLSSVFDDEDNQIWLDTWGHITPVGNEKVSEAMIEVIEIKSIE